MYSRTIYYKIINVYKLTLKHLYVHEVQVFNLTRATCLLFSCCRIRSSSHLMVNKSSAYCLTFLPFILRLSHNRPGSGFLRKDISNFHSNLTYTYLDHLSRKQVFNIILLGASQSRYLGSFLS